MKQHKIRFVVLIMQLIIFQVREVCIGPIRIVWNIYNNSGNTLENTQVAKSRIRDADMAKEMVSYFKNILLEQVTQTMLFQAN